MTPALSRLAARLTALALLLAANRPASADMVHCVRPLFAPEPAIPTGANDSAIPFTVLFGNVNGFDPNRVDPSFGDDSFTYYLRVGPGTVRYAWERGATQGNDSCDLDTTITFETSYERSYTRTSSTEVQTSLTSTLGKADVASIGSTVGVTSGLSESFTAGLTTTISRSVTIPPCTTVTWWHLYKTTVFDFAQFRQIDEIGGWGFESTTGTVTHREYVQSTITSATGKCVPAPSAAVLAAVGGLIVLVRRRRPSPS